MNFSVLMSVYINESASYLDECLNSLLNQTLQATEIVLVEDGAITDSLAKVIETYSKILPIKTVRLEKNKGLATALNAGLKNCSHELVLRMDADDISLPNRFESQVKFMLAHPEISVSSAWIEERDQLMGGAIVLKRLPEFHDEIVKFAKVRNPINHPVASFRKSAVLSVGGYPIMYPEDYALWSLMLVRGFCFANIQEALLSMRTGEDFIARRGLNFLKKEISLLKYFRSIGFFGFWESVYYLSTRILLRISPSKIRALIYRLSR
jgi:glycosyltransferase involved in cell wall biosynthesis